MTITVGERTWVDIDHDEGKVSVYCVRTGELMYVLPITKRPKEKK